MRTSIRSIVFLSTCLCCITTGVGAQQSEENIAELAQGIGDLSTLVTALKAANLVTALQGKGPFTVFAPSNAAFAKLPQTALQRLLEPQNIEELTSILKYHVFSGSAVYSKDLKENQNLETLQGQDLLVQFPSQKRIVADLRSAISDGVPLWCVFINPSGWK